MFPNWAPVCETNNNNNNKMLFPSFANKTGHSGWQGGFILKISETPEPRLSTGTHIPALSLQLTPVRGRYLWSVANPSVHLLFHFTRLKSFNSSHRLQRARLLSFMGLQQKPQECRRTKTNKHLQPLGSRRKVTGFDTSTAAANTSY